MSETIAWLLEVEGYKGVLIDNYQRALSEQEHFHGRGRSAVIKDLVLRQLDLHPLQECLRDNGDLIALRATVAQQAQMIEHLRGGPTPLYTAVDMATAAADGFRDGAASREAEIEGLRKDAERYRDMRRVTLLQLDGDTAGDFDREFDMQIAAAMSKEG